jgi:hypothetical protein
MISGHAQGHLGIGVRPPFPLVWLRTEIGFQPGEGGVKRFCPVRGR